MNVCAMWWSGTKEEMVKIKLEKTEEIDRDW